MEAQHRAPDEGRAGDLGGVGDEVLGLEGVGAVDHEVDGPDQRDRVRHGQALIQGRDFNARLQLGEALCGDLHLHTADDGGSEEYLAVDVGEVDGVIVDHGDVADTRGRQRLHGGAAETAGTDDEDVGAVQRLLLLGP